MITAQTLLISCIRLYQNIAGWILSVSLCVCTNAALRAKLIPSTAHQSQDEHEEIHNVQVEVQRREDVLLRRYGNLMLPTKDELRVEHQVEGEEESTKAGVHQVYHSVLPDERKDAEGKDNQDEYVEHPAHESKVPFGLRGKEREGEIR